MPGTPVCSSRTGITVLVTIPSVCKLWSASRISSQGKFLLVKGRLYQPRSFRAVAENLEDPLT